MKRLKRIGLMVCLANTIFSFSFVVWSIEPNQTIKVMTSFSILADISHQLGKHHIQLKNLVKNGGDVHIYRPKPSDIRTLSNTDIVISNGLGFEPWLSQLVNYSNFGGSWLKLGDSLKINTPNNHDPHIWQSLTHIQQYAHQITQAFIAKKPSATLDFINYNQRFISQIKQLETQANHWFKLIKKDKRTIITNHDSFGYLGQAFDIHFLSPISINTFSKPSAKDIASLITQIKSKQANILFLDNISNPALLKQIAKSTQTKISGYLYSDSLPTKNNQTGTYIEMMTYNLTILSQALIR